jgi:hypothetical protein
MLYLKMVVGDRLGKTLREVENEMTEEEILLWSAFYLIEKENFDKEKAKARGR